MNLCDDTTIKQLYTLGMAGIRFSREYPGYRSVIRKFKSGRFFLEDRDTCEYEIAEIISHADALTDYMESIVRKGIADGSIRSTLDPVELAIIIKMMIGCVIDECPELQWSLLKHNIDSKLLISHYMELMFLMFCGPEQMSAIKNIKGEHESGF